MLPNPPTLLEIGRMRRLPAELCGERGSSHCVRNTFRVSNWHVIRDISIALGVFVKERVSDSMVIGGTLPYGSGIWESGAEYERFKEDVVAFLLNHLAGKEDLDIDSLAK